ncbi:MAG: hypothetical protein IPL15_10950 [Comamonadaceae bacterium]|uniref:hypothetical protein n=1 Tax=Candidatus Skiveiella danica TaxID=3386177 RepID=UPI00390BAB19|nr:hypothetical protein [Comamonadaceae bacterium]
MLARDEAFSGEVVAQIERENESPAYVIEADGDRVMVPEVEGGYGSGRRCGIHPRPAG